MAIGLRWFSPALLEELLEGYSDWDLLQSAQVRRNRFSRLRNDYHSLQLYISCAPSLYALSFVVLLAAVLHLLTSLVLLSFPGLNRPALVFATLLLNALMLLLMSSWNPQGDENATANNPLFFIVSSLWGFCSGVWETLMISKFVVLFQLVVFRLLPPQPTTQTAQFCEVSVGRIWARSQSTPAESPARYNGHRSRLSSTRRRLFPERACAQRALSIFR